jgi:hypothetical protein
MGSERNHCADFRETPGWIKEAKKTVGRILAGATLTVVATGLACGTADAAPLTVRPADTSGVPIWLLPGVDLGPVLDSTIDIPSGALTPVSELLTFLNG